MEWFLSNFNHSPFTVTFGSPVGLLANLQILCVWQSSLLKGGTNFFFSQVIFSVFISYPWKAVLRSHIFHRHEVKVRVSITTWPSGPFPWGSSRRRIVLKPHKKEALHTLFQQNPYPGIMIRTQLDQEIGLPESRIQVGWSFSFMWSQGPFVDRIWGKQLEVIPYGQLSVLRTHICHILSRHVEKERTQNIYGMQCRRRKISAQECPGPLL